MTVVDASAILEILARSEAGIKLEDNLLGTDLHAPHLICLEIANTIRRLDRQGSLRPGEAAQMFEAFRAIQITRHAHEDLLERIWALRHNLTAYDASYLALAHLLNAELVTMDSGLRKMAARGRPH
jgi:predicted nucleic acid-binding protein